jgi:adenylate cyclase
LHFGDNVRLACQTTVQGDLSIRRPVVDRVDPALANLLDLSRTSERVGKERRLAVLFADITQYTPFAESLLPYDSLDEIPALESRVMAAEGAMSAMAGYHDLVLSGRREI